MKKINRDDFEELTELEKYKVYSSLQIAAREILEETENTLAHLDEIHDELIRAITEFKMEERKKHLTIFKSTSFEEWCEKTVTEL